MTLKNKLFSLKWILMYLPNNDLSSDLPSKKLSDQLADHVVDKWWYNHIQQSVWFIDHNDKYFNDEKDLQCRCSMRHRCKHYPTDHVEVKNAPLGCKLTTKEGNPSTANENNP